MSNFSGISSQPSVKGLNYQPDAPITKRTETGGAPAGAQQNPALVAWFEQANAYYNAVMAGDPSTPKPTEAEWNDFMGQLQWAQQQLGYGGAGGTLGMAGGQMGQPQGPQSNQFGGMSGTMDNWVYTNAEAEIGFTGNGTHDIWSNDVTINVAPVSGQVSISQTTDTRFQPNESVYKVVVTDPATGTEAVYFLHDFNPPEDKLNINTVEEGQVTGGEAIAAGGYEWGEFKAGGASDPNAKPDASIEGVEQTDGSLLYEPEFAGETVNFWANPNGADATEPQVHTVYADANISVKPSDEVVVTKNGDVVVVTVTHSDGSTDVYNIQKGYNVNINQKAEYVTVGGTAGTEGIPDDFADRVTLNGVTETTEGEGGVDADKMVADLCELAGISEEQLLSAINSDGYFYPETGDGWRFDSVEDLKKAIEDGEFPPKTLKNPDDDMEMQNSDLYMMLNLIARIDPEIKDELEKGPTETDYNKINDRLVEYFQAFYPTSIVSNDGEGPAQGYISITGVSDGELHWQFGSDNFNVTFDD
jgi:anti-sigma28 factor (negative regulator of flagellin synthesis)